MEPPGAGPMLSDNAVYTCTLMVISPDHWGLQMVALLTSLVTLTPAMLASHWSVPGLSWPLIGWPGQLVPLFQLAMCGAHDDIITLVTDNYQLL